MRRDSKSDKAAIVQPLKRLHMNLIEFHSTIIEDYHSIISCYDTFKKLLQNLFFCFGTSRPI